MKRLRILCVLCVALPILILVTLGVLEFTPPPQYESTAEMIVLRAVDPIQLEEMYDLVRFLDIDGHRVELYVTKFEVDRARLLEFCRLKEVSIPKSLIYRAYFFDDNEAAKTQAGAVRGLQLDEKARVYLKATYIEGELSITNLRDDHPIDQR
ncbi:hypothetical protein [Schlesneria paludicola]|uniref:hypothetical protein n=1 Tax=Schlesneria paludicola TaxID=360056 RepID=UPI0002EF59D7|nr:hypothetical protein [Schlesneria paludicola]